MIVRTRREMRNSLVVIPAGTRMVVTGKRNGFHLEADSCVCCGCAPRIRHVDPSDVDPA